MMHLAGSRPDAQPIAVPVEHALEQPANSGIIDARNAALSSSHISGMGRGAAGMQSSSRNPAAASEGMTRRILSTMSSTR